MKTLDNVKISICVKEHGAELASLKCGGREYLWQADEKYWKRHSPVLFPIVGSVWNGEYRSGGEVYKMGQHGFARDMDFTLLSEGTDEVFFVLESSEETLKKYPYPFRLEIGYKLINNKVEVIWKVKNIGERQMSFQIGAHPAFYWPMLSDEAINAGVEAQEKLLAEHGKRGYFAFEGLKADELYTSIITKAGCIGDEKAAVALDENKMLPLTTDTFAKDALVLENNQVNAVTLCSQDRKPYLTLRFSSPLVGLWSSPGKNAPFVCIEPWYGRADKADYTGTYEEKDWTQVLQPDEVFEVSYTIEVE